MWSGRDYAFGIESPDGGKNKTGMNSFEFTPVSNSHSGARTASSADVLLQALPPGLHFNRRWLRLHTASTGRTSTLRLLEKLSTCS